MTRIGLDVKFEDGGSLLGDDPVETLSVAYDLGFEGILVRTVDEAFPTLDSAAIREFAAEARSREMFVHLGLGKVNPYMTAELPRVRDLGDGSYLAGMERMIALCAEYGWTEAWTAAGAYHHDLPSPFCFDRFRTDVDWPDQVAAIARFLHKLAPTLREHGVRLNLETHEEITTFEVLRLIEDVGDDVLGVCLDPANVMVRGEAVDDAVRRTAPHVRLTHLRDAILVPTGGGLSRFLMPIGEGIIDWDGLLDAVLGAHPGLDLVIEGIGGSRAEMELRPDDAQWRAAHPDMTDDDGERLMRLGSAFAVRAGRGLASGIDDLRASPPVLADYRDFLTRSLKALRASLERRSLS
ncbi:sugar phosphate isomerase/epimerase family protein [Sinomonas sp. ASV322]|uniref:sugar phosphate isomerase/epimerase family protein n=1 Tax=Sinomonas sp. ASV322 TaxID=3041920 RepID=UPI0027DC1F19|nr:sugar phosphate isomerase/epimerase family protein [Sinomonas sp. ASV322]MDQ4504011.1 sugar phosphate isomerase/epimerase family protein [Sinomonas sp. ASV322]